MTDKDRSVVDNIEDGSIDIPHTVEGELALLQETKERLSMLKRHSDEPLTHVLFDDTI